MSLLETDLGPGRHWQRVGDAYAVTKKPRGLDLGSMDSIPFAAMEAIPQGGAYDAKFIPKAPGSITSGTYFERDDVLVGKITPSFENGKQAYAANLPQAFGYATTEVIPLHPKSDHHDPRLLFFYLLHPDIRHYVAERMEGSTGRQRVPDNVLLDLPMPAFEKDDQTRMANALELIQRAITAESQSEANARDLKNSAMRELFTRGLRGEALRETEFSSIPHSWKTRPLSDVSIVQTGAAKGRKLDSRDDIVEVPYLRVANVQDGHLDLREMKKIQIRKDEIARYRLQDGDVVLTEGGDFDKLGRGFIWRSELDLCIHQNHVFAVRTDREHLLPEFLAYLAQSEYGKAYFLKVAHKTTNLACINSTKLKAFPALLPKMDEQREIVEILDAIDRKIDLHKRKRAVLEELFRTLLHKLMTGEIDVNDLDLSALPAINA
jgi:type I restriction enzyme S subunit